MKRTLQLFIASLSIVFLLACEGFAQQMSPNTVKYKITYDSTTTTYTAWVVPDYNVPNANNANVIELGATAQFTVVVPKDFVITSLTDIKGTWEKPSSPAFLKLGPGQAGQTWPSNLNPAFNYYVIGKVASETNYGSFQKDVPVALFSFQGNGCYGSLKPLQANDPFIAAADAAISLNVGCSFYSRSGQPAGGNQNPLEQFVAITGNSTNCAKSTITVGTDTGTGTKDTPIVINVLDNDKNNGQPLNPDSVTVSISTPPKHGAVTIDSTGNVVYTPDPGFTGEDSTTYEICVGPECFSGVIHFDVLGTSSDLSIQKSVNKNQAIVGDVLTYTIKVINKGVANNTNIIVSDTLTSSISYVSSSATQGSYDNSTKLWTIPTLLAGDSATLTINTTVITQGVTQNYASIVSSTVKDSTLTNNEASACTTVPMNMCSDEELNVSIPATYTNVQWYKDGVAFGTGNAIVISASGNYTYTATNATCPVNGCCPIIVIVNDCCKPNVCVPYTVVKTKSAKR